MSKHEKLPSRNSTKSGAHKNFAKFQENEHTPGFSVTDSVQDENIINVRVCDL